MQGARVTDTDSFSHIEQLLLMAAAVQGLGPNASLERVNAGKVVLQALQWAGLLDNEVRLAWRAVEVHPAVYRVYDALIRMTLQQCVSGTGRLPERPGAVLFEGGGNWGVPGDPESPACDPFFNSCRLTEEGERVAQKLLVQHPEYRKTSL